MRIYSIIHTTLNASGVYCNFELFSATDELLTATGKPGNKKVKPLPDTITMVMPLYRNHELMHGLPFAFLPFKIQGL